MRLFLDRNHNTRCALQQSIFDDEVHLGKPLEMLRQGYRDEEDPLGVS